LLERAEPASTKRRLLLHLRLSGSLAAAREQVAASAQKQPRGRRARGLPLRRHRAVATGGSSCRQQTAGHSPMRKRFSSRSRLLLLRFGPWLSAPARAKRRPARRASRRRARRRIWSPRPLGQRTPRKLTASAARSAASPARAVVSGRANSSLLVVVQTSSALGATSAFRLHVLARLPGESKHRGTQSSPPRGRRLSRGS
jgi:hypothetical protein